jgi:hypothetical protein
MADELDADNMIWGAEMDIVEAFSAKARAVLGIERGMWRS